MVTNVHERRLRLPMAEAERLLRDLASHKDQLWPGDRWWPQRFEGGLVPGSKGGHGPVKYKVEAVAPREVVYRFPRNGWFRGTHAFTLHTVDGAEGAGSHAGVLLRHTLEGRLHGVGVVLWPLAVRSLHDALLEDVMDQAEVAAGHPPAVRARHSAWVRFLRSRWLGLDAHAS